MAYTDTVLAKNPIQYCTLTGAAYNTTYSKDLTGNGYDLPGYTSSTTRAPLAPGQNIGAISTVAAPNPLGAMVRAGEERTYTIELWATLNGWTFGADNSSAKTIIQNDNATCKIYAENSFIKFLITDSDGNEYIASTNFNEWGQAFYLVASYSPNGFSVSVNNDISDPVIIPKSSTFQSTSSSDLLTINNTNFTISHLAIYPKKLTEAEINSNYRAGKNFLDKEELVKTMGASSYSLSKKESIYSYQKTLNSKDFLTGNLRNLILDRDSIKCISYKPVTLTDSSGTSVSPDYTGSPAFLPLYKNKTITGISSYSSGLRTATCTAHSFNVGSTVVISGVTPSNLNETVVISSSTTDTFTYTSAATTGTYSSGGTAARIAYASIIEIPGLNSVSGYIGIKTKINNDSGVGQKLFTLFSKASNKSWSWYLDGSKNLHLKVTTYDSEDTSTSVIYDYQSAATAGQDNQIIWLTFDQSGIKISGWGTSGTPSGFNPNRLSGTADAYVDTLPEQLSVDSKTELIFNSDESYSGGIANRLYYIWIGSSTPSGWTSDFTVLDDADNLSVWYDFTAGVVKNLNARSQGEWTYTFDPAFEGKYYGSFVDYDLANDGLSKMTLKYRDGSYVDIKNKSHFPSSLVPFSGSFDTYVLTNITDPSPGGATGTAGNLLTANQASVETDASPWLRGPSTTLARVASPTAPFVTSGARFTGSGLSLTGTTGNYASSPNATPLQITGDIDLRCKVALDDWTPTNESALIAKQLTSTTRSYKLYVLPTGTLNMQVSTDGNNQLNALSTVATGIANGSTRWVRATRVASTGLVTFFLSDDGTTWTQLGATVSGTSGSIFNSSSGLEIGSRWAGASFQLKGTVYRAQILNGIDGTPVFDANFEGVSEYSAKMIESSPNSAVVTLNTTYRSEFAAGSYSLEFTRASAPPTDAYAMTSPRVAVVPGQTYTASALISGDSTNGQMGLYFYNSVPAIISSSLSTIVPAGATERQTITMVAPAGAVSAGLLVRNTLVGSARFDNMGIWAGTLQQIVSRTATTSEPHGFSVGNTVTISGSSTLNETVVITEATSTTFTYTSAVSGFYDPTDVVTANGDSGPFSIKAILNSNNITENTPELNYIKIYFYGNNELTGSSNLGNAIISGQSVIIKPDNENIFHSGKKLNCTFNAATGYIQFPVVSAGDYRSIEFTFTKEGTLTDGSVLVSSRNTANSATNQLLISSSNVVTVAGPDWPSSSVYLNGNLLSAGTQTALTDSVNHVLIIGTATTNKSLYLNANYDNTLWVSGTSKYSSYGYMNIWDYALGTDQKDAILASMKGIISATPDIGPSNAMAIQETASAKINTNPWSADSVI